MQPTAGKRCAPDDEHPGQLRSQSPLQTIVENNNAALFNTTFLNYVNNKTGSVTDNLHYTATVTYYDMFNKTTGSLPLASNRNLTGVEHPVRVTEWVLVNKKFPGDNINTPGGSRGGVLMARLNEDAQWIVLMGFIVSFSLFFLAIVLNQSIVVGQTTAESVLDFPKNDIQTCGE